MKSSISEDFVVQIWQSGIFSELETTTGETIHVIHPGRFSHGQAGDFQDAVLLIDGRKIYGNIEAHVRSSQWYSHKHHLNPKYNSTILHITYQQDKQVPTTLHNGLIIPTIALEVLLAKHRINSIPELNTRVQRTFECQHLGRYRKNKQLLDILAVAGTERLRAKVNSFLQALRQQEPDQVLFAGICRSLGYSQNSHTFEKLASKIQLSLLEQFKGHTMQQALLLGTAGLLPSQRFRQIPLLAHQRIIKELEQNWKISGLKDSMNETEWCFFRVRPANFPTRRIAALSNFLEKYRESGLMNGIVSPFSRALIEINYRQLIHNLIIPQDGYWANHCDFNVTMLKSCALIGHNKAADILLNTVLPFVYAWSKNTNEFKLECDIEKLYHRLPRSKDNELTSYMKRQLKITNIYYSACHQQGLLYIFKNYCRFRDCNHCPIAIN